MRGYLIAGTLLALATGLGLGWKWQLGLLRAALFTLAASVPAAFVLAAAGPWLGLTALSGTLAMWGLTVLIALAGLAAIFFRDPARPPPARPDVIVSPADGRVIYTRAVRPGQLPAASKNGRAAVLAELAGTPLSRGAAVAVGISMSLSDVHVNRAPMAGRIRLLEHVPGRFGSLRDPAMIASNERVTTIIDNGGTQIALVQIASRLVRRIVTFVSRDDDVAAGQRIGAIRFGSQVDLLIPDGSGIRLAVRPGDRVVAGQTIVALLPAQRPGQPDAVAQLEDVR